MEKEQVKKFINTKKFKWHVLFVPILIILCIFIGFFTAVKVMSGDGATKNNNNITQVDASIVDENFSLTISTVEEMIQSASDLITTKYFYTDADTYENYKELFGKKVPLTTDKFVFTYDGTISMGIDLSEVICDVNNKKEIITITLPEMKILSNEIDASSFEYPYTSDSIFNSTDMEDITDLIDTLKEKKKEDVLENTDILESAQTNTKNVLKELFAANDKTKDYTIVFES